MNDCSNADIRDQLPDLLHDRLSVSARAVVVAHVDACVDCHAELELLRGAREAFASQTPRVDIAYVVGALPKPPQRQAGTIGRVGVPAHRRWADWRVAAAVTLLVAGGSSVALLNRAPNSVDGVSTVRSESISTPTPPAAPAVTPAPSANSNSSAPMRPAARETVALADDQDARSDAGPDGRFAGLTGAQLQSLLDEIERLQPVPVTEPEPVTIKVNVGTPGTPEKLR
jgi:hypothetical protein